MVDPQLVPDGDTVGPGVRIDEIETVLVNCADLTGDSDVAADRVDHIFLSPDLTCSDFEYIREDASDHPAVAAEIGR